jgi:hypothetical protein
MRSHGISPSNAQKPLLDFINDRGLHLYPKDGVSAQATAGDGGLERNSQLPPLPPLEKKKRFKFPSNPSSKKIKERPWKINSYLFKLFNFAIGSALQQKFYPSIFSFFIDFALAFILQPFWSNYSNIIVSLYPILLSIIILSTCSDYLGTHPNLLY